MGTVEKLTLENMGIAFGILSLGGTDPEIHLGGGSSTPPPIATYVLKNTIATLGLTASATVQAAAAGSLLYLACTWHQQMMLRVPRIALVLCASWLSGLVS